MVAPCVGIDILPTGFSHVSYSAPASGAPVRIIPPSVPTGVQASIVLKSGDEGCYKALKKLNKKGYNVRGCYEKCMGRQGNDRNVFVGGWKVGRARNEGRLERGWSEGWQERSGDRILLKHNN